MICRINSSASNRSNGVLDRQYAFSSGWSKREPTLKALRSKRTESMAFIILFYPVAQPLFRVPSHDHLNYFTLKKRGEGRRDCGAGFSLRRGFSPPPAISCAPLSVTETRPADLQASSPAGPILDKWRLTET